ncbi:MAG: D-tyrosyl-tRNA(Tyr) deacylase [Ramalina farinacea]|uniref:D-aminoacyl-tRNA deacylase n=1 Tax=Ramalina farinacea TaxID=258253 RepID=A0AA43TRR5_9LECA|nr:D-tyrosyl-tRNA(Tyr) deacylase [Ramalina farinacea]
MASKVLKMKMWPDENGGTWKQNVQDIKGEVLCVSQFTLQASTKKGNKPDFHGAAGSEQARELYDLFYGKVQELYDPAKVTLEIDTNPAKGATESKGDEVTESKASREPPPSNTYQMPSELLE